MTLGLLPPEIHLRLKKNYIERLGARAKKIRKLLVLRDWQAIRSECLQLESATEFGLNSIAELARECARQIPEHETSRARVLPAAKQALDRVLLAIDDALIESEALQLNGQSPIG